VSNLGFALKDHLRGASSDKALMNADVDTEFGSTHSDHMPNHINTLLYKHIVSLRHAELIDPTQMRILDIDIGQINQIVSNCERIKATPIPYSYRIFIKKFLFVYIFTLPFGFGEQLGYYLAPIVSFVFYVLLSLEVLAESIEDPFGTDTEDLPLDGMSKMIQKDAAQILGLEYKQ
jgi:putative membrane protein